MMIIFIVRAWLFKQCKVGIVNHDDEHWEAVTQGHTCVLETYGIDTEADLCAGNITFVKEAGNLGMEFDVSGLMDFHARIATPGRFSVYNALTAIAICRHFNVTEEIVKSALLTAKVKGRIEPVKVSDKFTLMIDYAHNAMALKSLLTTLRAYEPHRLICLFGCGGNRAKSRRYEMGEVSGRMADLTIITSDNPRPKNHKRSLTTLRSVSAERMANMWRFVTVRKQSPMRYPTVSRATSLFLPARDMKIIRKLTA